jgi:hypothetical protein
MARLAGRIRPGTWRLKPGGGALLGHGARSPDKGIMAELIFVPGQRYKNFGWPLCLGDPAPALGIG